MFRIHQEGRSTILITCLAVILAGGALLLFAGELWRIIGAAVLLIFLGLIIYFFRVPKRVVKEAGPGEIIAPCDGKVVVIEKVNDSEFQQGAYLQISIFMSPLNVHVNWYPCSGNVVYKQYHPGKYLVAWHPKSSSENERTTTVLQMGKNHILIRQIAGAVARRIINYAQLGVPGRCGKEMGFIKFGSRVDILLPPDTTPEVKINQVVKGSQTIIARIR